MTFNLILILGAGGIGSAVGALLSKKNNVELIGDKNHVEVIKSKGLTISGDVNETFNVEAATGIHEIPGKTLVILATKANGSAKAVEEIKELLVEDSVVLVLQNGLGNEEAIRKVLGDNIKIVRGITTMGAEFFNSGEVRLWKGRTVIEESQTSEEIAAIFNECLLETCVSNDIRNEVWEKLVVNCVVNPLTAILRARNHDIFTDTLKTIRHQIVSECINVGTAEGITLSRNLEEKMEQEASKYMNYSSMYQDIIKRKKTEIDFLNGKIVELGKKHNIPTQVNETLTCLVKSLEEKQKFSRPD